VCIKIQIPNTVRIDLFADSSRVNHLHHPQAMMPTNMTQAYRPNMQMTYTHIKQTVPRYGAGEKHTDRDDANDADKLFEDAFGDSLLPFPSQPRRNVFIEPASGMKGQFVLVFFGRKKTNYDSQSSTSLWRRPSRSPQFTCFFSYTKQKSSTCM
jgi:hypothetical protein